MSESSSAVSPAETVVRAAFGEKNRNRLISEYFSACDSSEVGPNFAWAHIYRLLLWVDPTTGLAHCYESDKSQPGKNWYARSLAFHDWLSRNLAVAPSELSRTIDWLFLRATADLAKAAIKSAHRVSSVAERQFQPYIDRGFPKPGDDVELVALILDGLAPYFRVAPPLELVNSLVQRIRQFLAVQNKRKNLVGEGFEDVLAHVVRRACPGLETVRARCLLQDIPGFSRERQGDKPNKVDLALVKGKTRILVSAKWSVRADREKQFVTDFQEYTSAQSSNQPFRYVFVTNEFDPARLARACEKLVNNSYIFSKVVHINTDALRATYGRGSEETIRSVIRYMDEGRLVSVGQWITEVSQC